MSHSLMQLAMATLGALGFSLIFNVRGRQLVFTTLGGFLAWSVFLLLKPTGLGDVGRYLIASIMITVYAEICARRRKAPATVFLMSAVIPLVPGSRLYATMVYAVRLDWPNFVEQGLHTILLAGAIAAGIILVSTVVHAMQQVRELRRRL